MTADTRAAERIEEFLAEPMNGVVYDPYGTATLKPELESCIRTVLDSLPEWRDEPTVPGLWVYKPHRNSLSGLSLQKIHSIPCPKLWDDEQWLGPLQPPPAEQQPEKEPTQ